MIHVAGKVDPVEDTDVINFELALADITQIEKRQERLKKTKGGWVGGCSCLGGSLGGCWEGALSACYQLRQMCCLLLVCCPFKSNSDRQD